MNHFTTQKYWAHYNALPEQIRETADHAFALLKKNPKHPSLHLKRVAKFWSVRAGIRYRALGVDAPDGKGIIWFWIGHHSEYDTML